MGVAALVFRGRVESIRTISFRRAAARINWIEMSVVSGFGKALVIITGASKGFGRALALSVAPRLAAGSVLILAARSDDRLQELKRDLCRGESALTVRCVAADLGCKAGVEKVLTETRDTDPDIDHLLLFNNAGASLILLLTRLALNTLNSLILNTSSQLLKCRKHAGIYVV